jgi:chemotaxis protein CheD
VPSETPPTLYLNPGDYVFGKDRTRLRTILGSCVSVTFWHPEHQIGAMCHYLLPTRAPEVPVNPDGRYGDEVLKLITDRFQQQGLPPQEFHVKLFGGGNMFPTLTSSDRFNIGNKNVDLGRSTLEKAGFRILKQDVGHCLHRTVVFDISTGHVWVRRSPSKCEMKCVFKPEEGCPHLPRP